MWDPPGPGLEPMSPVLAGRLSTTVPPGEPLLSIFIMNECWIWSDAFSASTKMIVWLLSFYLTSMTLVDFQMLN